MPSHGPDGPGPSAGSGAADASPSQDSQIKSLQEQLQSALTEIGDLRQRALAESQSHASLSALQAESGSAESIWRPAWDGFRRGFVLAYGIRAGLGTMTRALALARAGQYKDMQGWRLVSDRGLQYREDAVRLGLFVGGFTGTYHLISGALKQWQGDLSPAHNCMAAGTAAGLTLMFLSRERRRTLALYMLARIAQCLYNSLKQQGLFHFWGSDWAYGDALLFALSSAQVLPAITRCCLQQVMYAYVMRPETLPASYWKFIVKSGPVEAPALEAVRRSIRKLPIDLQAFNAFLKKRGSAALLATAFPKQISDAMLHPHTATALHHNLKVPWTTFRKTFPLYMSISLVPYVVLNLKRALRNPLGTAGHAVGSAVRSTSFLSAFVGLYSCFITLHRKLFSWDHKLVYYVAGLAASGSILIEKKSRRSELALYVMPRAVDAFVLGLTKKRWVPSVKFGEVILFSLCMGGLMYYRQHEPDTMAPLLNTLISRIVLGQTNKSRPDLPRPASIVFSEGDFPGGHQQYGGYTSQSSSLDNSPTRGASEAGLLGNSLAHGSSSQPLTLGNSPIDSQAQSGSAALKARPTKNPVWQGNALEEQGSAKWQHGQDAASAPLQTSGLQNQSRSASAFNISDADDGSFGHAHGYNGNKDAFGAAAAVPSSDTSDPDLQSATNMNDTASFAQTNDVSTDSRSAPPSDSARQSHAAERSSADQDSFVELVQGTEQLLGMLGARAVLRVALGCPFISVESFHFCGEVYPDAGLITHRVPEAQVQVVRKTAMVEVGVWQAVLGYTLASSCGLLWCIEGVVNGALHGEAHSGLLRSSKFSSAWDDPEFVEAVLRLVLTRLVDSQLGVFAMLNFAISIYAVGALTTKTIFLGNLTRLESSHMRERLLKFLAFKVVMVAAVWSAALEDSPFWLPMISYLAYIKVFVGLAKDRLNGLLASPSATSVAHIRALALLAWIVTDNATWVMLHFAAFPHSDITYRLLWLFDAVVISVEALQTATIYGVQMLDRWRVQRAQMKQGPAAAHPWEGKGGLLYHIDLGLDLVIRMLSMAHVFHVWWLHGLTYKPMDAVLFLDIRSLVFSIHGKIRTYAHYCSATYNLQHNFPSIQASQLQSADEECAICKEPMKTAKVLPCGHVYHLGCLRDWLQQSGTDNFTCPICRTPLFVKKTPQRGTRQSWDQRLLRWLAGLWRPAPYAYLDQSSATTYQNRNQGPLPSAYHVTETSTLDHHLFHHDVSSAESADPTTSSGHSPAVMTAAHSSQQADAWQEPGSSSVKQQSQPARSRQLSQAGTDSGRHRIAQWQWPKFGWGSQQRGVSAAAASSNQKDARQHSTAQRELLQNVKAVVPHLTEEVILLELERTLDANQAVENLLSGI